MMLWHAKHVIVCIPRKFIPNISCSHRKKDFKLVARRLVYPSLSSMLSIQQYRKLYNTLTVLEQ